MSLAMPEALAPAADDDIAVVERARRGDRAAFDRLMRRHQRAVYRLALRYVRDPDEAADICQRAFVRALLSLPRFRGEARFRTWLYRIAMRLSLNAVRDRALTRPLDAEAPADSAERELPDDLRRLRAAVERLPPRQRAVVELRTYEDMSFRDVARVLATTVVAAKVNYHYAVKRLRKEMGP
jgi:RNA polymerase sigma-70 factor, ECF subfamily